MIVKVVAVQKSVRGFIKSRFFALLTGVVVFLSVPILQASEETDHWLMRVNDAATNLSFSGNFVYAHDNQVEAMQVVRRVDKGVLQERLYALNGEAREVVRDEDRVWCFIPDKNVGVHDYRQSSETGFPRILPADLSSLRQNYQFEMGGQIRVANRQAKEIRVIPTDRYRYGYYLWADIESGLLLRSDLIDHKGDIVEQYLFVNIEIGGEISDQELESVSNKEQLVWYGTDRPNLSSEVENKHWQVMNLPSGYRLTRHILRMSPMDMEEEEHMVITDGLSSVSIFVKKARDGQSNMVGLTRMGAIHAYRDTVENHWITVMGEVPADTVKHLAKQITYNP